MLWRIFYLVEFFIVLVASQLSVQMSLAEHFRDFVEILDDFNMLGIHFFRVEDFHLIPVNRQATFAFRQNAFHFRPL